MALKLNLTCRRLNVGQCLAVGKRPLDPAALHQQHRTRALNLKGCQHKKTGLGIHLPVFQIHRVLGQPAAHQCDATVNQPGALLFKARDEDGDGKLDITVRGASDARDKNPILNAIWIFPAGPPPNPDQIIAGKLNAAAKRYVDVGGENDQSLYPGGKLEYHIALPAHGAQELTFFAACQGGSAPIPDASAWTSETLRRAAREVWRDWKER